MKITECRITYLLFRKYSTYKSLPHNPRWTTYTNLQIWKFLRADSQMPYSHFCKFTIRWPSAIAKDFQTKHGFSEENLERHNLSNMEHFSQSVLMN